MAVSVVLRGFFSPLKSPPSLTLGLPLFLLFLPVCVFLSHSVASMVSFCSSVPLLCPPEQKGPPKVPLNPPTPREARDLLAGTALCRPCLSHLLSWVPSGWRVWQGLDEASGRQSLGGHRAQRITRQPGRQPNPAPPRARPSSPPPSSLWQESSESTNTTIEDEDTKGREAWPAEQTPPCCSRLPCCGWTWLVTMRTCSGCGFPRHCPAPWVDRRNSLNFCLWVLFHFPV